jgi:catechol 2,3-dioxygenase-like lactoylglutathione lyase family enzyme
MLGSSQVMAFAATDDAPGSLAFYRDVLGLRLIADEPFALVFDAGGTMLRIQKAGQVQPPPYTTLGWQVSDIEQVVRALREKAVEFERYQHLEQDAAGIWTTPDGTKVAWFKDPCGNLLSLTQF